jgi:hypothetical protein
LGAGRAASSKVSLRRGPHPVMSYTGVRVDRGQAEEQQNVAGVRVGDGFCRRHD